MPPVMLPPVVLALLRGLGMVAAHPGIRQTGRAFLMQYPRLHQMLVPQHDFPPVRRRERELPPHPVTQERYAMMLPPVEERQRESP